MTEEKETEMTEKKQTKDDGVFGGLLAESAKTPRRKRSRQNGEAAARPALKADKAKERGAGGTKRREYVYLQARVDSEEGRALDHFCVEMGTNRTDTVRALLTALFEDADTRGLVRYLIEGEPVTKKQAKNLVKAYRESEDY